MMWYQAPRLADQVSNCSQQTNIATADLNWLAEHSLATSHSVTCKLAFKCSLAQAVEPNLDVSLQTNGFTDAQGFRAISRQ